MIRAIVRHMMICPFCGAVMKRENRIWICPRCKEYKRLACPECGFIIRILPPELGGSFCLSCGRRFTTHEVVQLMKEAFDLSDVEAYAVVMDIMERYRCLGRVRL